MSGFRYRAFICYSHKDESWARWLHRALESYHVPRKLVGRQGNQGPIPKKLYPIFRDREELSSATDLSDKIKAALGESAVLVVICSPHAVQSHWVNEEIKHFQSLGRGQRIYSLIVKGDPEATDPENACFPQALLTDEMGESHEPLAADARKWADGRLLANLKLISGILGISLAELRQRDLRRRRWRWALAASTFITVTVLTSLLVWFQLGAVQSEKLAQQKLDFARDMVETKLAKDDFFANQNIEQDMLERANNWTDEIQTILQKAEQDDETLNELALEFRQQANDAYEIWVENWFIDPESAKKYGLETLDLFRKSYLLFAELYRRDVNNLERLSKFGLAEEELGNTFYFLEENDLAEESYAFSAQINRHLLEKEPSNVGLLARQGSILESLYSLEKEKSEPHWERATYYRNSSTEFKQLHAMLVPQVDSSTLLQDLDNNYSGQLLMSFNQCELRPALLYAEKVVKFARDAFENDPDAYIDPDNTPDTTRGRYLWGLYWLSNVQRAMGNTQSALASYELQISIQDELRNKILNSIEKFDFDWSRMSIQDDLQGLLISSGQLDQAWAMRGDLEKQHRDLVKENEPIDVSIRNKYLADFLLRNAGIAYQRQENAVADEMINEVFHILKSTQENPSSDEKVEEYEKFYVGDLLDRLQFFQWEHGKETRIKLGTITAASADKPPNCEGYRRAVQTAVMFGNLEEAQNHTDFLLKQGYREPGFMRFCKKYKLCE